MRALGWSLVLNVPVGRLLVVAGCCLPVPAGPPAPGAGLCGVGCAPGATRSRLWALSNWVPRRR